MLAQVDQDNIVQVIFLLKVDCALWANIAQAICCSVLRCLRSIQTTLIRLWTAGQNCTGNCLVQCRPRQTEGNITQIIFLQNNVCALWANITQLNVLYSLVSDVFGKRCTGKKILCNVVLILLEQHCTSETFCNVVLKAPDNIASEKSCSMLSVQCCLNTLGTALHRTKPQAMLSRGYNRQALHRKKS